MLINTKARKLFATATFVIFGSLYFLETFVIFGACIFGDPLHFWSLFYFYKTLFTHSSSHTLLLLLAPLYSSASSSNDP